MCAQACFKSDESGCDTREHGDNMSQMHYPCAQKAGELYANATSKNGQQRSSNSCVSNACTYLNKEVLQ
jgi:hypothetical protein